MKIILSRKGFDASFGGCPSPILEDGRMLSLPIPAGRSPMRFADIGGRLGNVGELVSELSAGKVSPRAYAHLDPDLDALATSREEGWRASLGQTAAAQSHLTGQGVGPGDVFLFFGWFRPTAARPDGTLGYDRTAPARHVLFGYLQIGESLLLGSHPDKKAILTERPWLEGHPHLEGPYEANNTVHIAAPRLVLDGRDTGLPGAAAFAHFHEDFVLTAPGKDTPKSLWRIPDWLAPQAGRPTLSYHGDAARWSKDEPGFVRLQTVAKGQEFVFDAGTLPAASAWVERLAQHAHPQPAARRTVRPRGP